jgi:exocyst complex component 5
MQAAEKKSDLTYLRILQSSRGALASLVDDLKGIKYKSIQAVESMSSITGTLDHNLDELFVPYLENSRYIDREIKSLQELYSSFLYKYNGFHVAPLLQPS